MSRSHTHNGWYSPDPIERRDSARRLIRRLCADHDVAEAKLGRSLGYTQQRFNRIMTTGERCSMAFADALIASSLLGAQDALIASLAQAAGGRFVRELREVVSDGEVMAGTATAMGELSELVSAVAGALPNGISHAEAVAIQKQIDETRRALNQLEAQVGTRVLGPARSSGR